MKYQVGDLIIVKECVYKPRPHLRPRLCLYLDDHPRLKNTYGVITETINHRDAWIGESTADDNVYFWYSQVDAKTCWFREDELTDYEIVK